MNKCFILHEDVDVFTSHGVLRVNTLYDAFKSGEIGDNFKIAGFYNGEELQSNIIDMKEINIFEAYKVYLTADLVDNNSIIVHPKQIFIDSKGNFINVDKINRTNIPIVALNGMVNIDNVSIINNDFKFYAIEVDSIMPTIFGSKILLFSVEDGDKNNPFFTESKKKRGRKPKKLDTK